MELRGASEYESVRVPTINEHRTIILTFGSYGAAAKLILKRSANLEFIEDFAC